MTILVDNTNPPLMLFTLNQALVYKRQEEGKWDLIADMITEAALRLEKAGAEQLMLCANTPHKVYELVTKRISTPILHIGDATAAAIKSKKLGDGLFFRDEIFHDRRLCDQANIPARYRRLGAAKSYETINELHRIIQEELTYGKIIQSSKRYTSWMSFKI